MCAPRLLVEEFVKMRNPLGNILHLPHNWLIHNVIVPEAEAVKHSPGILAIVCRQISTILAKLAAYLNFHKRKVRGGYPGTFIRASDA